MRFSIWPSALQPWSDLLEEARHAETTGWDGVWVADHFMPDAGAAVPALTPTLEAGSLVAALAAAVPRVRIGTLVYGATYRHPAVVANMAATVDQVSGGRFTLGLGAGWQVNEHEQYGIDLPGVRQRIDRFAEAMQVIRGLLTQERTTLHGEHYRVTEAICEPKPVQRPLPLLVGASGERRMLRLVAEHADQWNCWGLPDVVQHKSAVLDRHCAEVGRDPGTIVRTAQAVVVIDDDADRVREGLARSRMPAFGGNPDQLAEVVAGYAAAGVDELIVPDRALGTGPERLARMDRFITEVAARFR